MRPESLCTATPAPLPGIRCLCMASFVAPSIYVFRRKATSKDFLIRLFVCINLSDDTVSYLRTHCSSLHLGKQIGKGLFSFFCEFYVRYL